MRTDRLVSLGPQAEREWDQLRAVVELNLGGFWLALVCTESVRAERALRERTGAVLRREGATLAAVEPESPEALTAAPAELGEIGKRPGLGAVWVSAVRGGESRADDPWRSAWWAMLARLNELRDQLPRLIGGGLVLAGPSALNRWTRHRAIDLWSVRSAVIFLPHEPAEALPRREAVQPDEVDIDDLLPECLEAVDGPLPRCDALREVLRDAARLVAEGRAGRARERLLETLERPEPLEAICRMELLAALSDVEEADDPTAALDHAVQALSVPVRIGVHRRTALLDRVRRLASESGRLDLAVAGAQRAAHLYREQAQEAPRPGSRRLMMTLSHLGDLHLSRGRLDAAGDGYEESLGLARRLRELVGDTPEALRDLSLSLNSVGDLALAQGRGEAAGGAYEESLGLARRLRELVGDTPDSSVVLTNALRRVESTRAEIEAEAASVKEDRAQPGPETMT